MYISKNKFIILIILLFTKIYIYLRQNYKGFKYQFNSSIGTKLQLFDENEYYQS